MSSRGLDISIATIAAILLAVLFTNGVAGYAIVGNSVIEENSRYRIEQTPHTLTDLTNYATLKIKNKDSVARAIDVALGFDTSVAKPVDAWLWSVNAAHEVPVYGNVSHSFVCESPLVFSYQTTPTKRFWCNYTNGTTAFTRLFVNGWIPNATAEWFEVERTGTTTSYYPDWVSVAGAFDSVDWRGKKWFFRSNINFAAGEEKTLKIQVAVQPNTQGKYDLFAKLNSDTFQQAFDNNRYVLLDPWWNATFNHCRNVTVNEYANRARTYEAVNVSFATAAWEVKPYNNSFRVVDAGCYQTGTELPSSVHVDSYTGNNLTTGFLVFIANSTAWENKTYGLYYADSDVGLPTYADKVSVTNGTNIVVDASNLKANLIYADGAINHLNRTYGDNFDTAHTTAGIGAYYDYTALRFIVGATDVKCDTLEDKEVYATIRCRSVAKPAVEKYYVFYAHSNYFSETFTYAAAGYYVLDAIRNQTASSIYSVFYYANGTLVATTLDTTQIAMSKMMHGMIASVGVANEAFTRAKFTTAGDNASNIQTRHIYAAGRVNIWTGFDADKIAENMTFLVGIEPRAGASINESDTQNFYLKAAYPLNASIGAQQENATGVDTISLTIASPTNSSNYSTDTVTGNFTVTGSLSEYNCSRWLNGSYAYVGFVQNATANASSLSTGVTGDYNYTVYCANTTVSSFVSVFFSRIDSAVINLTTPSNTTYSASTVDRNFTVTGTRVTYNCSEWLNGTRTELGLIANNTLNSSSLNLSAYGTYNYTLYCVNGSSATANVSFSRAPAGLIIYILDELTGAHVNGSIRVENSTNVSSVSDVFYYNESTNAITGNLTITVNATGYSTRTVYSAFVLTVPETINVYLLNSSASGSHLVAFTILTTAYGTVVHALVSVNKSISGLDYTLAQAYSDGFGMTTFYLDSTSTYVVTATHASYGSTTLSFMPVLSSYTIILGGNTSYVFPASCLTNTSSYLLPNSRNLFRAVNQNITWSLNSIDSQLDYWGWRVDWNGTIINATNNTGAAGGIIISSMDFNASNATGLVGVYVYWSKAGVGECYYYETFYVQNVTGATGLFGALAALKSDTGIGDNALSLLALILIVSMVVYASRYTAAGGAAIGIIMLAFFTFITGWISPTMFLVLGLGGAAWTYFALQRGF